MTRTIIFLLSFAFFITCCSPKTSMDYYNLAKKQGYKKGKIEMAKANYLKAIELDSNNKYPYIGYGGYFETDYFHSKDTNDLAMARKYYYKAIAIDSNYAEAWFRIGYTYLLETRETNHIYTEKMLYSKQCFTTAIKIDSINSIFYALRAECCNNLLDTAGRNADWLLSCKYGNKVACWQVELERSRKQ
jgi:tetratricopeptide (TPR) repeat protein